MFRLQYVWSRCSVKMVMIQLFNQSNMGSNHQSINRISGSFLVLIVFIHCILILISEFDSFMNGFI